MFMLWKLFLIGHGEIQNKTDSQKKLLMHVNQLVQERYDFVQQCLMLISVKGGSSKILTTILNIASLTQSLQAKLSCILSGWRE